MIQQVDYQNKKLCVHVEGHGKPVLLLHGWPTNAIFWKAQRDFLKDNYQVITPEWLGFGQSDKPADHHYSLLNMKEMLHKIVAQLLPPLEPLTLVAHDIGGPAALLWASENQERIQSLIFLNTLFYDFKTPMDKLGHLVFGLPLINRIQLSNFGLSSLMQNLLKNKQDRSIKAVRGILKGHEAWPHAIRHKTIMEPLDKEGQKSVNKLAGLFKSLAVEKHLVIARKDPLCYAHMRRIHEENPEVPAYFLEDCGHYIPIDQPDELNKLLGKIF